MSVVVDAFSDAFSYAYDFVEDLVKDSWDYVVVPILEDIFAWFGIVDEDVIITQKISTLLFEDNEVDVVQQANTKSVMAMMNNGGSFYNWYSGYINITKAQIEGFYRFAKNDRYIHGLPIMTIKGGSMDFDAVDLALDDAIGVACTRLSVESRFPPDEIYFKHEMQPAPRNYKPGTNMLSHIDPYGVTRHDYTWDSIAYNAGNDTHEISISRIAEHTLFWIEGPVHIVEGDSATFTVRCNRAVPVGESVTVNFVYSGTAPTHGYSVIPSATITAGNIETTFDITTVEEFFVTYDRTIIVTIDSITNTNAAFESVGLHTQDSATVTVRDDEGVLITVSSHTVAESSGTVTVAVKLEDDAAGSFVLDYSMIDGTAIGGVDYDNTPGTLSFAGTAGEIQVIIISITSDAPDDNETFTVEFTACTDATVDFSQTSTVTITDGSTADPALGSITLYDTIIEPGFIKEHSLIVAYHWTSQSETNWFYWVYKYSDNTYVDLDASVTSISNLEMLPLAILRRDKVNIDVDKTTQEYITTRRLLNTLDISLDDILANIDENPDIGLIDDMHLNFAINPTSTAEITSHALWLMFYNIIVVNGVSSSTDEYSATLEEQDVETAFVWTKHAYTVGLTGVFTGEVYEHNITILQEIVDEETGEVIQEAKSTLAIRKKTSEGVYSEIIINNLNGMAAIAYDGFHQITFTKLGEKNFTLPISYYIISQMNRRDQMRLYQHILRIDAHAIDVIHLEWYETQAFFTLFQFAMIIISIVSLGSATGPLEILKQLLFNYLIMELVVYLAEITGNAEFAAVVGFVAMLALGDATNMAAFDFASAEGLLIASTEFANNLTAGYTTLSQDLAEDLKELNALAEERMGDIEEATPEESPITSEFLVALNSIETIAFPAIKAQYDFDLLYNYDRLIKDYFDINLQTGVI